MRLLANPLLSRGEAHGHLLLELAVPGCLLAVHLVGD